MCAHQDLSRRWLDGQLVSGQAPGGICWAAGKVNRARRVASARSARAHSLPQARFELRPNTPSPPSPQTPKTKPATCPCPYISTSTDPSPLRRACPALPPRPLSSLAQRTRSVPPLPSASHTASQHASPALAASSPTVSLSSPGVDTVSNPNVITTAFGRSGAVRSRGGVARGLEATRGSGRARSGKSEGWWEGVITRRVVDPVGTWGRWRGVGRAEVSCGGLGVELSAGLGDRGGAGLARTRLSHLGSVACAAEFKCRSAGL